MYPYCILYLKLGLAVGLKDDRLFMLLLNVVAGLRRPSLDCIHISSSTFIWLSTMPGVDLQRRPTNPVKTYYEKSRENYALSPSFFF